MAVDGAAGMLLQRVSRRPCLLAVAGLLVVVLDVRVGFVDLLPDAIGYAAVAYAVSRPVMVNASRAEWHRRPFSAALVGLASAVPELVSVGWTYHPGANPFVNGSWSTNTFGRLLALVGTAATAVLLYSLCGLVARLASRRGLPDLADRALGARQWVAVPVCLDALLALVVLLGGVPAPDLVGATVSLGVYAAFATVIVFLVWLDLAARAG